MSAIRRRRKCAMGATFPHATSVQNRLADQRRNVRQRIGRIKRTRRFHIPSFLDQVFGSLPVACTRPESPPTTPPKRPWALCVGNKLECVWPGNSSYHIQITSVHRLAIGFPSLPAGLYTHIPRRSVDAKKTNRSTNASVQCSQQRCTRS